MTTYRYDRQQVDAVRSILKYAARPELDNTLSRYELAFIRSVRERITSRQMKCMTLYFLGEKNTHDIARELEINGSTVSRNIRRGLRTLAEIVRLAREISPINVELWQDFDPDQVDREIW